MSLATVLAALNTSGVAESTIPSIVSSLASLNPNATVLSACSIILQNSANMPVVQDEAKKLAETPNLPSAVSNLLPMLNAATSALQVVQIVQAIETAVGGNSTVSLL